MKQETLSRRKMLKTLAAAGGGLTAAAFLPAKWVKPVVQSGVLPVHAQASASVAACTLLEDFTISYYEGLSPYVIYFYFNVPSSLDSQAWETATYEIVGTPSLTGFVSDPTPVISDTLYWESPMVTNYGMDEGGLYTYTGNATSPKITIKLKIKYPDGNSCISSFVDYSMVKD